MQQKQIIFKYPFKKSKKKTWGLEEKIRKMLRSKSMLGFVNEEMDSIRDTELDW